MIAGTWATVFCSVRSCGRGALVLHLGLFIYPLSLHTTRDGVQIWDLPNIWGMLLVCCFDRCPVIYSRKRCKERVFFSGG